MPWDSSWIGRALRRPRYSWICRSVMRFRLLYETKMLLAISKAQISGTIASSIANAYIDFSKMTLSLVAVVTDVVRDGRPVLGYGFNVYGNVSFGSASRGRAC